MAGRPFVQNFLKSSVCVIILVIFAAYFPHTIITSENHTVITGIGKFQYAGHILIVAGIVGYCICFWNFIVDAKGSPLPGDTENLIVKGLYRHVRNPIYLSVEFILLGEALVFRSLQMFYYLFGWVVLFHIFVVFVEEPFLRVKFGATYEQYCKSVRRWIPKLKAYGKGD